MSYVARIINAAEECARENGLEKISGIEVEAGEMTGALPEYLEMYFKEASRGTILEGAKLSVLSVPVKAECAGCGEIYAPSRDNSYRCPHCKSSMGKVIQGKDVVISRIAAD